MPRANRFFASGYVWHITHRCHKKEFLLKFNKDRLRWRHWLFEARKRYGLCVLNYVVTSNHVHLLVYDSGKGEIARSMQLIAGRTAQEYNQRKHRRGAYWEDRYHATAIDTDAYLARCMVYIDMNMVRAGVVNHPCEWGVCGYNEIQYPPKRYLVIDQDKLIELFAASDFLEFQQCHRRWLTNMLNGQSQPREQIWSSSIAVGADDFVETIKTKLGIKARYREVDEAGDTHILREPATAYSPNSMQKNTVLREENTVLLNRLL